MAFSHGYGCFKSHMKDEISALLFSCFSQISVIRETEKGKITLLRHAVSGR